MKKIYFMALITVVLAVSCVNNSGVKELRHYGKKDIKITEIKCDTVYIDGSSFSLEGKWVMKGDTLLWFDKYTHGAHLFSIDGQYITRRIEKGDGPHDMQSYPWAVCGDKDGGVVILDANNMIHRYDNSWQKKERAFYFQRGAQLSEKEWTDLYNNPSPENTHMYEYNFNVGRISVKDDSILIVPAITEHIKFNGYATSMGSVEYWQKAYNFMTVNMKSACSNVLFGHFPAVYREKNIPIFSSYDFAVGDKNMYVGYAADSTIYVMDNNGNICKMIGFASDLGEVNYPETFSFDEAEENMSTHRKKYGRYLYLDICGEYLFRSYKKSDNTGYGLQIYYAEDMIGDIATDSPMRVVGHNGNKFYAFLSPDKENDVFRMVVFEL